ncbi:uncharacterized protein LOC123557478 isoform X2 [Mercenaria mercenaria]|nr:uncharacterized protein LOC123557478 isoform X2 [Mercenaria mercenaria]XP_053399772.1 uncharacterized protein LOC123557478 isoform X2 [Mercenaria mercenaria]XP_053399773.1 uncharacterized protein LOC123557478 isoform X2 [Mercenaria mercenaria]XP_053399774.1 uncharacterized protein LOC123557478 isoform X2 [Mercenaria mercenaria]
MQMRYLHHVALVLFFILLFEKEEAKSWKDYNLTVGPLENESGRYVYNASVGGKTHCRYCDLKALKDSTYSYLQQPMCIQKYNGKKVDEEVLPDEKTEMKYPLCDRGDVPGCGPPPDVNKTKNHVWKCDPGISLVLYSVYFSCALVCNVTDKVEWNYYCNETLQWHAQRSTPWQPCEVPVTVTPETRWKVIVTGSVIGGLVLIIIFVSVWRYRRQKRARSNENVNVNGPGVPENQPLADLGMKNDQIERGEQDTRIGIPDEGTPDVSLGSHTSSSHGSSVTASVGTGTSSEHQPLLPPAGSHTRDMACSTDGNGILTGKTEEIGAVGGQPLPNGAKESTVQDDSSGTQHEVKPSISIILTEGGEKKQSIPLQGDLYSITKGRDFAIIPNSTGGLTVKQFNIDRKDMGKPFRGKRFNFWYVVEKATEDDAGLFIWKMRLENNVEHIGSFEIGISVPPLQVFSDVRVPPIGQEDDNRNPSVFNPRNPLAVQPQQPSSTPPLKVDSLLSCTDKNTTNNNITVNHCQQQQCRAEIIPVKAHSINPLLNPPPLIGSSLFESGQQVHSVDSGLQTGHRPSSEGRNSSHASSYPTPNRMNGQNHSDNAGIRSEDLRSRTSGYESQSSTEIAQQRFGAHFNGVPNLNVLSFESGNVTNISADIHRVVEEDLSDIPEDIHREDEESCRPDPAGGASLAPHIESHRNDNPDDQTFRKYVDSDIQQHAAAAADDDDDVVNDDTDSISDRLDSIALQKEHLFPNSDEHNDENTIATNENTNPRGETEEIEQEKDIENHVPDTSERKTEEIEQEKDVENHVADTSDREDDSSS